MAKEINKQQWWYDQVRFRVWPDGTVQDTEEPPHAHMSDDYYLIWAYDEEEALRIARAEEARHG